MRRADSGNDCLGTLRLRGRGLQSLTARLALFPLGIVSLMRVFGLFLRQLGNGTYIRWGLFSLFLISRMGLNEEPAVNLRKDESQSLDLFAGWRASMPIKTLTIV